jgi:hypothetical protein
MTSGKFESEKEEAEYRDRIDTTTLDDLEEVELEYEPGIPDIIVKSVIGLQSAPKRQKNYPINKLRKKVFCRRDHGER